MPSASMKRPSSPRTHKASSTTRRSPTKSPRVSMRHAGSPRSRSTYLREARYGYLRWGADGKVRQLDQLYPRPQEGRAAVGPDEHDRGAR